MKAKQLASPFATVLLAAALGGCAGSTTKTVETPTGPMPEYCVYNNTATGAVVGGAAGAALGGGGLRSLVGAAIGAGAGAAAGSRLDDECRQIALQHAMEAAERQAAAARAAAAVAQQRALAAQQAAMAANQPPPPPPVSPPPVTYQPVDYVTPSNHQRHRIVPLKSYTDPATKQTCNTYSEFTFTGEKPQISGSHTACKGADGVWHG